MRRSLIILSTAGAALAAALVAAQPAAAGVGAATRLTVSVKPATGPAKIAWLTCQPAGGTHQRAVEACATLAAAGGDPRKIPDADGMCTMEHAPVTLKVTGHWQRRTLRYKQTFSNACVMDLGVGAVSRL